MLTVQQTINLIGEEWYYVIIESGKQVEEGRLSYPELQPYLNRKVESIKITTEENDEPEFIKLFIK
nr:MAG TPA: hypothetical protein [Caudoviricetes sp.]